jgi:hypothetical protein
MITAERAERIARRLLARPLPRRWAHTRGVAAAARALSPILGQDTDLLVAAGWLHDVGYAPALAAAGTGFHPLDGARYLRDTRDAPARLCALVAYHSEALDGAARLGLAAPLTLEFPPPPPALADALTFADMTTSPDGLPVTISDRLAEIRDRYGPGHIVTDTIAASTADLTAAVHRIQARLTAARAD